jgi:hypothetical protein
VPNMVNQLEFAWSPYSFSTTLFMGQVCSTNQDIKKVSIYQFSGVDLHQNRFYAHFSVETGQLIKVATWNDSLRIEPIRPPIPRSFKSNEFSHESCNEVNIEEYEFPMSPALVLGLLF